MTFFTDDPDVNPDYKAIRDREHCKPYRDFLDYLWARYDPSGDGNECFLGDAKTNFRQRFWEMYLFCALEDRGIAVQKTTDKCGGPDFSFEAAGKKYWVEAIAPVAGSGNDKVPFPVLGAANYVPRTLILLRYTNALSAKFKYWFEKCVDKNIVSSDDGYIIAINGGAIPDADCDREYPYIIQSLYPIGPISCNIDTSLEVYEPYLLWEDNVKKQNGVHINTAWFIDKKYSQISAVIHSFAGFTSDTLPLGGDFILVHNPFALHPLPDMLFSWLAQYSFENGKLMLKKPVQ